MTKQHRERPPLPTPSCDLFELTNHLGQPWGVSCGERIAQYLAWADAAGIFSVLEKQGSASLRQIAAATALNCDGADALLSIVAAVDLVRVSTEGAYELSDAGRTYFLEDSPYYAGPGMFLDCDKPLPHAFRAEVSENVPQTTPAWSIPFRLSVQHSRNFAPAVVAARSGEFAAVKHLVDIAGGSGVLAIPLALDRPDIRITLVERSDSIDSVRSFLSEFGVANRVDLIGMDVFAERWNFGYCDGIFFGNFFHAVDDSACGDLARLAFASLAPGGRIWLHEILFNNNRSGPLIAALWNANMIVRRKGARQRTASELVRVLEGAGFTGCYVHPTAGGFSLVGGYRPV